MPRARCLARAGGDRTRVVTAAFGRAETVTVGDAELSILLVKNPAGANEILRTLRLEPGEHELLMILNDRIADGRDVSWIWDADFEILSKRIKRATCSGTRAAELALRLKYAGVAPERLQIVPPLAAGLDAALRDSGGPVFVLPTSKLKALPFGGLGLNFVYVDDVADGILLAHDRGTVGESYVLGGEVATMRDLVQKTADIAGRKPPKRDLPSGVIKLAAPAGPLVGKMMGFPPNFRELISASDGVTYWAKDDKARAQLDYRPRDLATGLRQTLEA